MTMTSIPVERIRADDRCQPRVAFDNDLVVQYAASMVHGDEFPPVTVFHDGVDYFLADGFHRYHAVNSLGLADINAIVKLGSLRDAVLFSCSANASHGWRRTNDDKRRAVMRLLNDTEWSRWSDREIARHCLVSPQTVNNLRPRDTVQNGQYEPRTFIHPKTGQPTTMNTASIGGARESQVISEVSQLISGTSLDCQDYRETIQRLPPSEQMVAARRDLTLLKRQVKGDPKVSHWQDEAEPEAVTAIDDVNRETKLTNCIWDILKAVEALPEPKDAGRRFPGMLLHTVEETQLLHVSAWFVAFAAEIKTRGMNNVAA